MNTCPQCQRTYDDSQRFCPQDGTPLVGAGAPAGSEAPPLGAEQPQPQPHQSQPPPPPYSTFGTAPGGGSPPPPPGSMPPPAWQAARPRRKIWPWVLGGVAVLGLGTLLLFVGGAILVYKASQTANSPAANTNAAAVPVATKTYVNSREGVSAKLRPHYADFSFSYPETWTLDPEAGRGDDPNFVKVERDVREGGREYTLENFAVGWYTSTGTLAGDRPILPRLVNQISSQFAQSFPNYEKVSEGETRVGGYEAYEFRFKGLAKGTPRGDVTIYGRTVMIPGGDSNHRNGVALIMLASSLLPEIEGVEDVGVKGETPVILNSFRLGAPGGGR